LDADLIKASFAFTYGILPSEQMKLRHCDYSVMMAGLSPDSPLIRIIRIRREKTVDELKKLTEAEQREYFRWQNHKNSKTNFNNKTKKIDEAFKALL
jgi:hypothetical protein